MTTAATPPALMAFPKYPELPPELRLMIIEEALQPVSCTGRWYRGNDSPKIGPYARVDRQWNRVVELRLFKNIRLDVPGGEAQDNPWDTNAMLKEFADFGAICGKRSGRLNRIEVRLCGGESTMSSNYQHLSTLFHLFQLMKDWDHQHREQQGLIGLVLNCGCFERLSSSRRHGHPYDLAKFPSVPIIGSIHGPRPRAWFDPLHPSTVVALCQKLPNVHHTTLTLPYGPTEFVSTENFIDAMDSLRVNKPGMTHLDLKADSENAWTPDPGPKLLPIIQRLSASPTPWSDRLVSLKVHHNIVVHDFLRDTSETMWPNLKIMKLLGAIEFRDGGNGAVMNADDVNVVADETGTNIIEALITALPCMPKVTKVHIKMLIKTHMHFRTIRVKMHLGNIARTENTGKMLHCGDKFVHDSTNGVTKTDGILLHGDLAAKLQDVVRSHRRQELEVFACTADGYYYQGWPHRPCTQWNRQSGSWDPVFENDMEILIYEMGQYWEGETWASWDLP